MSDLLTVARAEMARMDVEIANLTRRRRLIADLVRTYEETEPAVVKISQLFQERESSGSSESTPPPVYRDIEPSIRVSVEAGKVKVKVRDTAPLSAPLGDQKLALEATTDLRETVREALAEPVQPDPANAKTDANYSDLMQGDGDATETPENITAAPAPTCEQCGGPLHQNSGRLCNTCYRSNAAANKTARETARAARAPAAAPPPAPAPTPAPPLTAGLPPLPSTAKVTANERKVYTALSRLKGQKITMRQLSERSNVPYGSITAAVAGLEQKALILRNRPWMDMEASHQSRLAAKPTGPTPPSAAPAPRPAEPVGDKTIANIVAAIRGLVTSRQRATFGAIKEMVDLQPRPLVEALEEAVRSGRVKRIPPDKGGGFVVVLTEAEQQEEIDRHIAEKGVTRPVEITEPWIDDIMAEIQRDGPVVLPTDDGHKGFTISGKPTDREGLVAQANRLRIMRGAPVWDFRNVKWERKPEPTLEERFGPAKAAHMRRTQAASVASRKLG